MITEGFVFLIFKIVDAKGVGGEEAVVAGMPMGGATEGIRVIDDGDDGGFAEFIGSGVSDPVRAFSPGIEIGDSFGVGEGCFGRGAFDAEGAISPDGEGAFFGITENDFIGDGGEGGMDVDAEGFGVGFGERVGTGFLEELGFFRDPCQVGSEPGDVVFDFLMGDGIEADRGIFFLSICPEIVAVDGAVGEPDAAVVGVVPFLAGHVRFHGPVTENVGTGGGVDGVKVGEAVVGAKGGDEVLPVEELDRLSFFG